MDRRTFAVLTLAMMLFVFGLPAASLAGGITFSGGTPSATVGPMPATRVVFRETSNLINLGTAASPCLNAGTTASSAVLVAGTTYRFSVMSETISFCMAPDANCDAGVMDLVPGTQFDVTVATANAGTAYCRSAGGTGYATLRSP